MTIDKKIFDFLKTLQDNPFKPDFKPDGSPKKRDTAKRAEDDILALARDAGFQEIPTDKFKTIKKKIEDDTKYKIGTELSKALNLKDPKLPGGLYQFGERLTKLLNAYNSVYTKDKPIIIKHPSNTNRFPDFLILYKNLVIYLEIKTHWDKPDYGKNPPKHFAIYFEIDYKNETNAYTFGKNMVGYRDQWELEGRQKAEEDEIAKIQKRYHSYAELGTNGRQYFTPGGRAMGSNASKVRLAEDPNKERYQEEVLSIVSGEVKYDELKPNYDLREEILDERWEGFVETI